MNIRIAFIQLLPGNCLAQQLELGKKACEEAKAKGADIALFPEMWSDGYRIPQDRQALNKLSIEPDGSFVRSFASLAAQLRMAVAITFLEKGEGAPLNSVAVFDRRGQKALHYSKVHTCAFEDEKMLSGGGGFYTADLDLEVCTVRIGAMICFDREFPESARILMLKGAELILAPNACPMEINRLSALRTRAYENMLAVATCNYPEGQPDCNGHSTLFDGVPWLKDEPGVRDMCVFEAPEKAGVYIAELDLDRLRRHRETDVMGGKYRRPDTYRLLSLNCQQPPFPKSKIMMDQ
ncbi:MAG: carbon-nitrogen hydrolase family protein [Clostridia bacterium]|nr:carbon-nitrogen hydrolase family protein [Clostridia bacterium]